MSRDEAKEIHVTGSRLWSAVFQCRRPQITFILQQPCIYDMTISHRYTSIPPLHCKHWIWYGLTPGHYRDYLVLLSLR
jgi:hypothetical protein